MMKLKMDFGQNHHLKHHSMKTKLRHATVTSGFVMSKKIIPGYISEKLFVLVILNIMQTLYTGYSP
jgi:hypothetical protein